MCKPETTKKSFDGWRGHSAVRVPDATRHVFDGNFSLWLLMSLRDTRKPLKARPDRGGPDNPAKAIPRFVIRGAKRQEESAYPITFRTGLRILPAHGAGFSPR